MGNTPTEEDTLTIAVGGAIFENRPLRAAAGVEAEVGVVFGATVLEVDIVADLEGKTIPVVVARDNIAKDMAIAVLDENATGVIAVYLLIFIAIAIEDQIADLYIVDPFGCEDRKESRGGGSTFDPGIFLQATTQIERLIFDMSDRVFDDLESIIALGAKHDAAAWYETTRVLDPDLGFIPVRVADQ